MKHLKIERDLIIVGLGFVGQANALALLKMDFNVWGIDVKKVQNIYKDHDFKRIKILKLEKISNYKKNSKFTCPVLVCVNAPTISKRPFQNLAAVENALKMGRRLSSGPVILRTTLLSKFLDQLDFDIYMPEFLHKKYAVIECLKPKFVVLGFNKEIVKKNIPFFVKKLLTQKQVRLFICSPQEASFVKYTLNLFNALRISFINEIGDFIKQNGFNPHRVIDFIFQKKSYLRYGKSFSGNCLPKDIKAFADEHGSLLFTQIAKTNNIHKTKEGKLRRIFSTKES